MMKVSVIIPVYNERGNIGPLVKKLSEILDSFEHELIIVDDCSVDDSVKEIDPKICKILLHDKNKGKGAAMKTGIDEASGNIIGFIDGDAQDDPEEIFKLIKEIENGADLAIGSRFKSSDKLISGDNYSQRYSKDAILPINEVGNKILTNIINKLFNAEFSDVCASFRFYKADVLRQMNIKSKRYEIETEMAIRAIRMNLRIVEVPVKRYSRIHGISNLYQVPFGRVKFAFRVLKLIIKCILFWK